MGVHVLAIGSEPLESIGADMAKSNSAAAFRFPILSDRA